MKQYFKNIDNAIENLKKLNVKNNQNFLNNNINIINENLDFIYNLLEEYTNKILNDFTSEKRIIKDIIKFCNMYNFNILISDDGQLWEVTENDLKEWENLKVCIDYDLTENFLQDNPKIIIIDTMTSLNKRAKAKAYYQKKKGR